MTYANLAAWDERQRMVSSMRVGPEAKSSLQHSRSYTGNRRWQVVSELWRLFEECHTDGWDEYGAKGVAVEAFKVGLEFVEKLPLFVDNPEVGADPDGDVSFEWFKSDDTVLTLSINSERKIAYAGAFGQERPRGIENFGSDIPSAIRVYLSKYFGNVIPLVQDQDE